MPQALASAKLAAGLSGEAANGINAPSSGIRRLSSLPKDAVISQTPHVSLAGGLAESRTSLLRSLSMTSRQRRAIRIAMGEATDSFPAAVDDSKPEGPSVVQHSVAGDLHMARLPHLRSGSGVVSSAASEAGADGKKQTWKERRDQKREVKAEARKEKAAERVEDFDDEPDADFFQVRRGLSACRGCRARIYMHAFVSMMVQCRAPDSHAHMGIHTIKSL